MKIEKSSGIQKCFKCLRKKKEAIEEQTKLMKVCESLDCPFRKEIEDAILTEKQKTKFNFGKKQKSSFKFGEKQQRPQQTQLQFSDSGELIGNYNVEYVLNWIKGKVAYRDNRHFFDFKIEQQDCFCTYTLYAWGNYRGSVSTPRVSNVNKRDFEEFEFWLSDLNIIDVQQRYYSDYQIELVSFIGNNIRYKQYTDKGSFIGLFETIFGQSPNKKENISSFIFEHGATKSQMISALNYVINYFK
jgi:hypothetical protein